MTNRVRRFLMPIMALLLAVSGLSFSSAAQAAESNFSVAAKAAIAIDAETGKIFYNQDADTPMGIASITKTIGLYLVEEQIKDGKLNWDDPVTISEDVAALSVAP